MPYLDPPRPIATVSRMPMTPTPIALVVGLGVGGAGVAMAAAALAGAIAPSRGVPGWLLPWVGGLFLFAGAVLVERALAHWCWQRRARRVGETWRRDYPWPLAAVADSGAPGLRQHAVGLALLVAILVPLHLAFLAGPLRRSALWPGSDWIPPVLLALFDFVAALSLGYLVLRLARRGRFGRASFRFEEGPPYRLGGTLRGRFEGPQQLALAPGAVAILRAVEERMKQRGSQGDSHHVQRALYEESQPIEIDTAGGAQIAFALPAAGPATALSEVPTCYWELVVRVARRGLDYEGVFLVPVYGGEGSDRSSPLGIATLPH